MSGAEPMSNLLLAEAIAKIMGKSLGNKGYKLIDYYSNQPAHELHSALDCSRLMKLEWSPVETFESQLEKTVKWLLDNPAWLQ